MCHRTDVMIAGESQNCNIAIYKSNRKCYNILEMENRNSSRQNLEITKASDVGAQLGLNTEGLRGVIRGVLNRNGLGNSEVSTLVDATFQNESELGAGDPIVDGLLRCFQSRVNPTDSPTQTRATAPAGKQRLRPQDLGRLR